MGDADCKSVRTTGRSPLITEFSWTRCAAPVPSSSIRGSAAPSLPGQNCSRNLASDLPIS